MRFIVKLIILQLFSLAISLLTHYLLLIYSPSCPEYRSATLMVLIMSTAIAHLKIRLYLHQYLLMLLISILSTIVIHLIG